MSPLRGSLDKDGEAPVPVLACKFQSAESERQVAQVCASPERREEAEVRTTVPRRRLVGRTTRWQRNELKAETQPMVCWSPYLG
jgi:hypothetical protein